MDTVYFQADDDEHDDWGLGGPIVHFDGGDAGSVLRAERALRERLGVHVGVAARRSGPGPVAWLRGRLRALCSDRVG